MELASVQETAAENLNPSTISLEKERNAVLHRISGLKPKTERYATEFVDAIFDFTQSVGTSDVHLQPTQSGLQVQFRHDGVLQTLGVFPSGANSSIVARLKVISDLLTYQSELPQEGRVAEAPENMEVRVSTFPTLYGERAVLRFFGNGASFRNIDTLGHAPEIVDSLKNALLETNGAVLVTGPAGSGKSTTLYACMRHLVDTTQGARCLVSIEDPIEVPIDGVSQSKVNIQAGFDLNTGLRSLLRQDPEVIMVGEIRDRTSAEIAIQASMTGQLVLTTFHADSAATAISRLTEMGIEPYLLRSGLNAVMCQRLIRRLCDCAQETREHADFCGLPIDWARIPGSCEKCDHTGFVGRMMISEFLSLHDDNMANAVLSKAGSREINRLAVEHGMSPIHDQAITLARHGKTSPAEVRRVLGGFGI